MFFEEYYINLGIFVDKEKIMDIGSGNSYPSNALSNFAPHPFVIDGVLCNSYVCTLVGTDAKFKGKKKKWWITQTLYWQGEEINRHSEDYQQLLDLAYSELLKNNGFRKALLATGNLSLTHSLGKNDSSHTVLTENEFCSRLLKLRKDIQREKYNDNRR